MKKNLWMLEVLDDMQQFAEREGFPVIGQKLSETRATVASELARRQQDSSLIYVDFLRPRAT